MSKQNKARLLRLISGGMLFLAALLAGTEYPALRLALFLCAYATVGFDVLWQAVRRLFSGQFFDENFLMSIATIGAFFIGEYPEGVAVMLFYQLGELFQDYAVDKSRRSIANLMDIRPDYANVMQNGELVQVEPAEVKIGDMITIKAGERVPLDGIVVGGSSSVDTSALTGESMPSSVEPGSELLSGCININGTLTVRVTKEYGESTVNKILDLVENAASKKSRSENFITRFAKYYTPAVVLAAVLIAVLPPLILDGTAFTDWLHRALSFLVVSCPCALVISVPLSFFGSIGGASRRGILVKGGNYLEALAKTEIAVFDKTGTLTKGVFNVSQLNAQGVEPEALLEYAAYAEHYSNHPIAASIKRAYGKPVNSQHIEETKEIPGLGVSALVKGQRVLAGNIGFMEKNGINPKPNSKGGTVVHVAVDAQYIGHIVIADELKQDASDAIRALKTAGVKRIVMLTGDAAVAAQNAADKLEISETYSELLPAGKLEVIESLLEAKSQKGKLVFMGDGINDAPALARADIGVAMGALGSDAAIEAADVVLMTDEPKKLAEAIKLAKRVLWIVKQNIAFALGVKALVLLLVAGGISNMWEAVFADVGVAVIAILNAMRVLKAK